MIKLFKFYDGKIASDLFKILSLISDEMIIHIKEDHIIINSMAYNQVSFSTIYINENSDFKIYNQSDISINTTYIYDSMKSLNKESQVEFILCSDKRIKVIITDHSGYYLFNQLEIEDNNISIIDLQFTLYILMKSSYLKNLSKKISNWSDNISISFKDDLQFSSIGLKGEANYLIKDCVKKGKLKKSFSMSSKLLNTISNCDHFSDIVEIRIGVDIPIKISYISEIGFIEFYVSGYEEEDY